MCVKFSYVIYLKLIDEYEFWSLKLNVKKTKYTPIRDIPRDMQLEDGKGTINYVNEYTYLRVKITKDGNHEPEMIELIEDEQL